RVQGDPGSRLARPSPAKAQGRAAGPRAQTNRATESSTESESEALRTDLAAQHPSHVLPATSGEQQQDKSHAPSGSQSPARSWLPGEVQEYLSAKHRPPPPPQRQRVRSHRGRRSGPKL